MDEKMRKLLLFGKTWWGKQWIESMLKYGRFFRMQRAVNYAKDNRISDVIIKKGEIFAQCQGTAPVPYRIKVKFTPLTEAQWNKVIPKMAEKAYYEARLLDGEMPDDINKLFIKAGVPLFPPPSKNLDAHCNCPDQAVPCKHIAALILTLAKIFDFNPFKLIKLRGMDREQLLNEIEKHSMKNFKQLQPTEIRDKNIKTVKITQKNTKYFLFPDFNKVEEIHFNIDKKAAIYENILSRIGKPPDIESSNDFMEVIREIYKISAKSAIKVAFKQNKNPE
ncbi:MAG: SWIM zinc finger family protein [Promethearchaeota archaeon]